MRGGGWRRRRWQDARALVRQQVEGQQLLLGVQRELRVTIGGEGGACRPEAAVRLGPRGVIPPGVKGEQRYRSAAARRRQPRLLGRLGCDAAVVSAGPGAG